MPYGPTSAPWILSNAATIPTGSIYSGNITISLTTETTAGTVFTSNHTTGPTEYAANYYFDYETGRRLVPLGDEDEARLAVRRAARERESAERRQRVTAIADRARELLLSLLDETQRADYTEHGMFSVRGSHGGLYRIERGTMGNVQALDPITGAWIGALCAHPTGGLPDADVAVAQMLHLMTDEPGFVGIANVHSGRRPEIASPAA